LGLIITELAGNKLVQTYKQMRPRRREVHRIPDLLLILKRLVSSRNDATLTRVVEGLLEKDEEKRLTAKQVLDMTDPKKSIEKVLSNQNEIIKNQGDIKDDLKKGFARLEQRMQGLFKTFVNLTLDKDSASIPKYIVMLRGVKSAEGAYVTNIINNFKDWTGIDETFHIYICDEGPLLSKPLPPISKPLHDPIQVTIPGKTLRSIAPLLNILNAIILTAKVVGTVTTGLGAVIPNGIPGLDELDSKTQELAEYAENMLSCTDEEFETFGLSLDKLENHEDTKTVYNRPNGKGVTQECYKCLKALLLPDNNPPKTRNNETLDRLLGTKLVRMVNKNSGVVRWFGRSRLDDAKERNHLLGLGFEWDDRVFDPQQQKTNNANKKAQAVPSPPATTAAETPAECCTLL